MEKQWIKFIKEWTQKAVPDQNIEEKIFKSGDIIQIGKATADMLIELGLAEKTEEPEDNSEIGQVVKKAEERFSNLIEKTVSNAFDRFANKLEDDVLPVVVKDSDHEGMRGFKDEGHFLKCVMEAHIASSTGKTINPDRVGGVDFVDYLTKAPSGQNVSVDTDGGFLVPDVMSDAIWDNMENNPASILPLTDRFQTSGNSIKVPVMFESSRKAGAGKRHAGIQVTWLDEAGQIQATQASVQKRTLELHKLGAVVYFTEEQLDDAPANWNSRVRQLVPEAIMFEVNDKFYRGTGVGQPKGILNLDPLALVALENNQGNHTLLHKNLSNLYWRNTGRGGRSTRWEVHPDAAQQMEYIYFNDDSSNQRPIYMPINQGLTADAASIFKGPYGKTMNVTELASDFASVGDVMLIDWSQYATLTKTGGGVKTASSIHVRFLFEETAFRFTFRIGGDSFWTSTKEDFQGDTKRSPFTALASRTGGGSSSGL